MKKLVIKDIPHEDIMEEGLKLYPNFVFEESLWKCETIPVWRYRLNSKGNKGTCGKKAIISHLMLKKLEIIMKYLRSKKIYYIKASTNSLYFLINEEINARISDHYKSYQWNYIFDFYTDPQDIINSIESYHQYLTNSF